MLTREDKQREMMKHHRDKHHYHQKRKAGYDDVLERERIRVESDLFSIVAILGILFGLLFLSPNITGNVIGSGNDSSNIVGITLLIMGLIAGFAYFKRR
jgi:uncharacterized membrane protein HdeD (DUF308 family)